MTIDELMQMAFGPQHVRTPRSPEYKAGARAVLDRKINGVEIGCPYHLGTAQADAFFAGIDEGHAIWKQRPDNSGESR